MATSDEHLYEKLKNNIRQKNPDLTEYEIMVKADEQFPEYKEKHERRREKRKEEKRKKEEDERRKNEDIAFKSFNEYSMGASLPEGLNMSISPLMSVDGADSASISSLNEDQSQSIKVNLKIYYSIYEEDEIFGEGKKAMGDQIAKNGLGEMQLHREADFDGAPFSTEYDKEYSTFIECNDLLFNIKNEKIEDDEGLRSHLDRTISFIINTCKDLVTVSGCDLYVNIGGYDIISDLIGVTKYILSNELPKTKIDNEGLSKYALDKYKGKISQLKTDGCHIVVSYTATYKASGAFADAQRKIKEQEEEEKKYKAEIARFDRMEKGFGGGSFMASKALLESGLSGPEALHVFLGLGSMAFWAPPFALICSVGDLVVSSIELGVALYNHDRKGATNAMKNVMIDGFFLIPFAKIGKFIRKGTKCKLASHNEAKIHKSGKEKNSELVNKAKSNSDKIEELEKNASELESKASKLEKENIDLNKKAENAERKVADLEEKKLNHSPEHESMYDAYIKASKEEASSYRQTISKNESEKSSLLEKAKKDRGEADSLREENNDIFKQYKDVYNNMDTATNRKTEAYTQYKELGPLIRLPDVFPLEDLLKVLRDEWKADKFGWVHDFIHNRAGNVMTIKGSVETLKESDSQSSKNNRNKLDYYSDEDFSFTGLVSDAVASIW